MKNHPLAKNISRISHPVLTFPICLILLFGVEQSWQSLSFVISFTFGLPFLFFLWLFFTKKISDFDVSQRKQRYPIYALSLVGMLASLTFIYFFESDFLFNEFLRLFLLAIALVCINFKIKVSIHVATLTTLGILLTEFYEGSPWIFLLVPLVAVSRLLLKRHSWLEVCLGALLPFLFYFSSLVPAFAPIPL